MSNAPGSDLARCRFYLPASALSFPATAFIVTPQLCELAAEDAAWTFERDDWRAHRPAIWQRRRMRRWRRSARELSERRAELHRRARTSP